jgi:hypothetical protein
VALNDRKGGLVARIRINPKDCLAILDIIEALDLNPYQHSFSGCVSLAMTSLLALARKQGVIRQEEDGFQFLNRIGPFLDQPSSRVKRERTNALYERAQHGGEAPTLPHPKETGREEEMQEYLSLKGRFQGGDLTVQERFLELQSRLF